MVVPLLAEPKVRQLLLALVVAVVAMRAKELLRHPLVQLRPLRLALAVLLPRRAQPILMVALAALLRLVRTALLLAELVVKEVHGSGGYGMLVGPAANKKEIRAFREKLKAHPANYIAQPTLALSTVPIFVKKGLSPRHVDLRPFVLMSPDRIYITPGGLTRVAMTKGSLVVNSSQGGGTKDTWVLEE